MDKSDRRHSPRQTKEATIQVVLASDETKGRRNSNELIPVKMCNQSDKGLYMEIDRALMPGSNVRIKMVPPEGYDPEEVVYMRDGRVIRCEKIAGTTPRFGIGIKILRKFIQAHVVSNRFR